MFQRVCKISYIGIFKNPIWQPPHPNIIKTRYKCCAQHNGRVANYCHVPLVIRRVYITSTPQAIHLLALCGEVINIHLRTKKDRSRSSIFELEIHPWCNFGINATNIDLSYMFIVFIIKQI